MTRVINAIRNEHQHTAQLIAVLSRELDVLKSGDRPDYDLLLDVLEYFRLFPDSAHHRMEDLIYSKLISKEGLDTSGIIDLRQEHKVLAQKTDEVLSLIELIELDQEIDRDTIIATLERFMNVYREHMLREERDFLPFATKHLSSKDWADISEIMANPDNPYTDPYVQGRADFLHQLICKSLA